MQGKSDNNQKSAEGTSQNGINMSKTLLLCHVVFCTKRRMKTIPLSKREELYKYICGILSKLGCRLIRINGVEDHVHILFEQKPTLSLSEIMKAVKQSSSFWLNNNKIFPNFEGWGSGYFAVTVSPTAKETCKRYIMNQELHHKGDGFVGEIESMIKKAGLVWMEDEWV